MTRQLVLVLLWAWSVSLPAGAQTPPQTPLVTVYFSEHPPFSIVEGQRGILVDLTKAVLSEAGIRSRFIELPPNRILDLLRSGPPDALGIGWYRTPDREAWARFSTPLYQEGPAVALVGARASASLGNPVALDILLTSGLTLGTKGGTSLGPSMDQKIRARGLVPIETVVEIPQLLQMVQAGRMDYTILCQEEAEYLLLQGPFPGLVETKLIDPPPGNQRYILFPPGFNPTLADRIDVAIDKVRSSDRYRLLVTVN